ncbi:Trk system potassium transporter TrkA [Candidatus Kapabacteria bacterium]|nr:Trk system potassium transporter TrkA [Candidatus Kapabacteria bacterium]
MNILIIGAGNIGSQLAKRLSIQKHSITIVEQDHVKSEYAKEHLDAIVIEGSATDYKTLLFAGIESADIVASLSNSDEVNLFVCQVAKKLNVESTIARVRNPQFLEKDFILNKKDLGVDYFIHPEKEAAEAILRLIRQTNATDVIEFEDGKIKLLGIRIERDSQVLNIPLHELSKKFGRLPFTLVAIKRNQYTIIPSGSDILLAGDQIFLISKDEDIEKSLQILGKKDSSIDNVMIIGGGMISRFICEEIDKSIKLKIIEKSEKKAAVISEKYRQPLIILGDGSDLDLLNFEGLMDMDAFVSITGDDETNIITSLVAKHLEVPRTITLIAKSEYIPLTPTIGLDSVISKQQMTVNSIQKFIRRKQVALFAEIPGVDAEVIEFIANEGTRVCKRQLSKIKFPKKTIVGAILKGGDKLEVPKGDTQIEPGDKVIVVAEPEAINEIERLFR